MEDNTQTIKAMDNLLEVITDPVAHAKIERMRNRLQLPMSVILEKVPGRSIKDKARTFKMSRQSWYGWMQGTTRPNLKRARQLSKLTGYSIEEIRGH